MDFDTDTDGISTIVEIITELTEMGYTHAVVAVSISEDDEHTIYHIVGYSEEPTPQSLEELVRELATDDEFSMTDLVYQKDYQFILLSMDEMLGDDRVIH